MANRRETTRYSGFPLGFKVLGANRFALVLVSIKEKLTYIRDNKHICYLIEF